MVNIQSNTEIAEFPQSEEWKFISDPVDNGAEKIINFVDKVTSLPQRVEMSARELNDYLIGVGDRIKGESQERAVSNLGSFKASETIQGAVEKGLKWAKNNYLIIVAVVAIVFILRK